jgi:hypothetical protein
LPICRNPFVPSRSRARRRRRPHLRCNRRSPQLALPPIRPFPQRCPRMLNPSTSARAMAAIASTSCAGTMRCGVATIRAIGEGKTVAPKRKRARRAHGLPSLRGPEPQHRRVHGGPGGSRRKHPAEGCGLRVLIRLTRFVVGETLILSANMPTTLSHGTCDREVEMAPPTQAAATTAEVDVRASA